MQKATAAEIGSQRLPGRSALPALRSMASDLSNLLLSSVIVHFHPAARRGSRAGGIVLALVVARSRSACLAKEGALSFRRGGTPSSVVNPVQLSRAPGGARFSTRRIAGI